MPRQSAAAAQFGAASTPVPRLIPPAELDQLEREEFLNIVLALRPDHFEPCDGPLLGAYVKAVILERVALGELRAAGYVDAEGKPSGWLKILAQATRTMSTYSRLLRLNPQAREPLAQQRQAVSYYERMALEGSKRDEAEPKPS
jgi:phage terminase small subunit